VRQAPGGDVGIDALIDAGLGVVLAPGARIHRHHIRRLIADPNRHDYLVVAVHRHLAVVALQLRPT